MNTTPMNRAISNVYQSIAELYDRCDEEALGDCARRAVPVTVARLCALIAAEGEEGLPMRHDAGVAVQAGHAVMRHFGI